MCCEPPGMCHRHKKAVRRHRTGRRRAGMCCEPPGMCHRHKKEQNAGTEPDDRDSRGEMACQRGRIQ